MLDKLGQSLPMQGERKTGHKLLYIALLAFSLFYVDETLKENLVEIVVNTPCY
jgi:hypothetical protein